MGTMRLNTDVNEILAAAQRAALKTAESLTYLSQMAAPGKVVRLTNAKATQEKEELETTRSSLRDLSQNLAALQFSAMEMLQFLDEDGASHPEH